MASKLHERALRLALNGFEDNCDSLLQNMMLELYKIKNNMENSIIYFL